MHKIFLEKHCQNASFKTRFIEDEDTYPSNLFAVGLIVLNTKDLAFEVNRSPEFFR